ncbi:class D sortase [Anaerotruncus rubiinfantis]|uniref:class D sortase n=1 Tax=Anaerotruncus rubiinfantis TaxID=1720200 RepID=UPI000836A61C|nr:class D sortase [Anaerotruncus rubiinfantis]
MNRLKGTWQGAGKWFLIGLPLAVLILGCVVWRVNTALVTSPRTVADSLHETEVTFDLDNNRAYTADDGVVVIAPESHERNDSAGETEKKPERQKTVAVFADTQQIWDQSIPLSTENYTLPDEIRLVDGSIGTLIIPKINLSASVYETVRHGEEMESMTKGIAHFAITSAWDGNIGLCSHNEAPEGAAAFFRDIHLLRPGDELTYKTAQGERRYKVTEIKEISEDDWSYLMRCEDGINRVTMITCITGKPNKRLMVQATEV